MKILKMMLKNGLTHQILMKEEEKTITCKKWSKENRALEVENITFTLLQAIKLQCIMKVIKKFKMNTG